MAAGCVVQNLFYKIYQERGISMYCVLIYHFFSFRYILQNNHDLISARGLTVSIKSLDCICHESDYWKTNYNIFLIVSLSLQCQSFTIVCQSRIQYSEYTLCIKMDLLNIYTSMQHIQYLANF